MRRIVQLILFSILAAIPLLASAPDVPKVDKVLAGSQSSLLSQPGVFFHEEFETITSLNEQFQNVGDDNGNFYISTTDHLSGGKSLRNKYRPLTDYGSGEDPGNAGYAGRFFGNKISHQSSIPAEQQHHYYTVVASWYHKFEEGFQPRDGWHFPPKMARMRCYEPTNWDARYSVLFWVEDEDGHLSIERHTNVAAAHREWLPNHEAGFRFSEPVNVGRWVHFELRVALGPEPRTDRIQAWADGLLVCDIAGDDIAAGDSTSSLNAMQWDCYWNGGSPVEQSRYYDDLVLSTERVGPRRTGFNPEIVKGGFIGQDGDTQAGWELEIAQGVQRQLVKDQVLDGIVLRYRDPEVDYTVVWRGALEGDGDKMTVDTEHGEFTGPRAGQTDLAANTLHFARVRQQNQDGEWSAWSPWHAGFATDWAPGTPDGQKSLPAGYLAEAEEAVLGMDDTPAANPPAPRAGQRIGFIGAVRGRSAGGGRQSAGHACLLPAGGPGRIRARGHDPYQRRQLQRRYPAPGFPAGSVVEYYIRAVDGFEHYTYMPEDYENEPYKLRVLEHSRWDLDGNGRMGIGDLLKLVLSARKDSSDPALDYDGDGEFGMSDLLAFMREIMRGGAGLLAGLGS